MQNQNQELSIVESVEQPLDVMGARFRIKGHPALCRIVGVGATSYGFHMSTTESLLHVMPRKKLIALVSVVLVEVK